MSSPEINYKIGNESLIQVLPNASERLLGLLENRVRLILVLSESL